MSNPAQDTKTVTGKVRLSYVNILKPRVENEGEKPKYSVLLLIPKSDKATVAKLKKAATAALAQGIASGKLSAGAKLANNWQTLKDGDEREDLEERPEYAGHWYMNVSAITKPGLVDRDLDPILDESEVYSGMYGRVSLGAFAYNAQKNKGITFGLNNVQKLADGDPLGGRSSAESDFASDFDDVDDDLM